MPEDAGTIYSAIMLKLTDLQSGVVKVESLMNRMVKSTQKQSTGFASFWRGAFQTAFGMGAIQIITKLTGAIKNAIGIFSGFQQSMRNVQSVTNAVGEEYRLLTEKAKTMGETTRFTARESADALYYLGSAGFSAQQSIAALDGVLQLAGATQSDLASTAESVAAIISQYSLQAEDATRISNTFAAAIGNSQATMEKLSNAFRQVGPVAAGFNMSVEQTTGALQELFNAGFKGQQAGRALKSALADLAAPTTKIKTIFNKLGIELNKVNPELNSLDSIIDVIGESGASTSQIISAFGKVAGPQMAVLIKQGGDALRKYTDDVTDTEAAAEAYRIQNDSLAGSMDFLKSKLESTAIAIFEKLEPGMRDLIDTFIEFLDAARPVGELLGNILNIFFKIAAFSTGAITKVFDGLLGRFQKLKTPMQEITDNLNAVRESIEEAGEIQKTSNKLSELTDEYEKLSSITNLTKNEQDRLRSVISQIERIVPGAATKFDEYGNAIEISGEKSREAARQMLISRKAIIEQAKASLQSTEKQLKIMVQLRGEELKTLKMEETRYENLDQLTTGRYALLIKMRNEFKGLLEDEIKSGRLVGTSFQRGTEGVMRYTQGLKDLHIPMKDFRKAGSNITAVLDEIDKQLVTTEKDFKNYQDRLSKRIEIDIEIQDMQKKINEIAGYELELKNIDNAIKTLGETTEKEEEKTKKFTDASEKFWDSYKKEIEKATREASLFGEKQDVLKATLDFLRKAYLELIEQGIDPASKTMTRLRQEYDLTLTELNALIEKEKEHGDVLKTKEEIQKEISDLTEDYYNKIYELGKSEKDLIDIEREKALAIVRGSRASQEAVQGAIDVINEYFDKLKEAAEETRDEFKITFDDILGYAQQLAGALSNLFDEITQDKLDALDQQLEDELEAAGLSEETERERLERQLQDAIDAGDTATAEQLQDALDRLTIEEEFEKKKAWLEYEAALNTWRLNLLQALASGAQVALSGFKTEPFIPVGLIAGGIATGIAALQVTTVAKQKPTAPSFESGGLYLGPGSGDGPTGGDLVELHPPEGVFNQDQMENLFDMANNGGGNSSQPVNITVIIELEGQPIYKGTEQAQHDGTIRFKADRLI